MITVPKSGPFVADEPEFASLRPDMLQNIRNSEVEMRTAMLEMISSFPDHWRPRLEPIIVTGTPKRLIRSLLPFFIELSKAFDVVEMVQKRKLLDTSVLGQQGKNNIC
jgi:hypothetical protein